MGTTAKDHPLRHAPFRWLVSGTTVNLLGSGIAPVALAFAVLDLGGGAAELGLVVGLYALADVGAVLFGGVLGDRLPRTVMLQGSAAAAAVVQGLVAATLIGGFAGATADAFTLFERLETKLEQYPGQLLRAAVELAKDWRTDRYLRRLEAMMIGADKQARASAIAGQISQVAAQLGVELAA